MYLLLPCFLNGYFFIFSIITTLGQPPSSLISNCILSFYIPYCTSNSFSILEPEWSIWNASLSSLSVSSHHLHHHHVNVLIDFPLLLRLRWDSIMWFTRTCIFWPLHEICLHHKTFIHRYSFYMKCSFLSFFSQLLFTHQKSTQFHHDWNFTFYLCDYLIKIYPIPKIASCIIKQLYKYKKKRKIAWKIYVSVRYKDEEYILNWNKKQKLFFNVDFI